MSSTLASQLQKSTDPPKGESRQPPQQADTSSGDPADKKAPATFNGRTRAEILKAHAYGKKTPNCYTPRRLEFSGHSGRAPQIGQTRRLYYIPGPVREHQGLNPALPDMRHSLR